MHNTRKDILLSPQVHKRRERSCHNKLKIEATEDKRERKGDVDLEIEQNTRGEKKDAGYNCE